MTDGVSEHSQKNELGLSIKNKKRECGFRQIIKSKEENKMPKKICNHCGRVYEFECECRKKRRKFSKTKDIYNSTRWKKVSKKIRARDFNCDRFALFLSVCDASKLPTWTRPFKTFLTLPDGTIRRMNDIVVVHHIEPVDENSSSWFDENNLISLYQSTHEMIHKLYETELKNEVQLFLKKIVSSNVF